MRTWTFQVQGAGHFPLDMLRYDACYPTTGEAAVEISDDWTRDDQGKRRVRTVHLCSHTGAPTNERWSSFGWVVVKDSVRRTTKVVL